jgi:hypothetical protein
MHPLAFARRQYDRDTIRTHAFKLPVLIHYFTERRAKRAKKRPDEAFSIQPSPY